MVEAPPCGPVVERPRGAHLAARREVPLAEAAGDVAVLAEDARQGGAAARARAGVAGERPGELGDAAHTLTRWWLRPVSMAARVGEHTAVTWKRLYVSPISCTRVRLGVLMPPPKVSGPPKPASSMRTRSTLGALLGALGPGMNDQSAAEPSSVRPAAPPKVLSGIGSTVLSGLNLPAASASAPFSPLRPRLSIGATDLAGEPASACSAARRSSSSMMAMIAAVPGLASRRGRIRDRCRPCVWRTCRRCRRPPHRRRSPRAVAGRPSRRGRRRRRPSPYLCGRGGHRSARRGPRRSRRAPRE